MIKKHHPQDRAERRRQKMLHDNASPVFKLLQEKEMLDAASKRAKLSATRQHTTGIDRSTPDAGVSDPII